MLVFIVERLLVFLKKLFEIYVLGDVVEELVKVVVNGDLQRVEEFLVKDEVNVSFILIVVFQFIRIAFL